MEFVGDETSGWDTKGGAEMTYIRGAWLYLGNERISIGNISSHVNLDHEDELYHADIQDSLIDCLEYIKQNKKVVPLPRKI